MRTILAILLIILSLFIHKIEGIFSKKYSAEHNKGGFVFTAFVSFFSMVVFLLKDLIGNPNGLQFEKPMISLGLIAGACFAAASMTMYWVLEHGPYGLSSLVSSYGVLITIGHGLIVGERLSFLSWVGVVLICASLFLIMARRQEDEKIKISVQWLPVLVFSVLCTAAFGVLQRQQQIAFSNVYNNEFMVITLSVSAVLLFAAGVIKDGKYLKDVFKYGFFYAAGGGVANGVTNFLTLLVYTLVPISFAAPMKTGISIVMAFLIARLIFKEKYTLRQCCGVALGCIALILFNI